MTTAVQQEKYLDQCKSLAIARLADTDPIEVYASFIESLDACPETRGHRGITAGAFLVVVGNFRTPEKIRTLIQGFI